jgi:hypothetical protein
MYINNLFFSEIFNNIPLSILGKGKRRDAKGKE